MATSFATPEDLALLLETTFDTATLQRAELELAAASADIRAIADQDITAVAGDIAVIVSPAGRWISLPQKPVTAVTSVMIDNQPVTDYIRVHSRLFRTYGWGGQALLDRRLFVPTDQPVLVTVTYDHGYETGDDLELARQCCLAAAAARLNTERGSGQGSVAIDDYREPVAGDPATLPVGFSEHMVRAIQRTYGRRQSFSINTTAHR